jgi:hypothetical protein
MLRVSRPEWGAMEVDMWGDERSSITPLRRLPHARRLALRAARPCTGSVMLSRAGEGFRMRMTICWHAQNNTPVATSTTTFDEVGRGREEEEEFFNHCL